MEDAKQGQSTKIMYDLKLKKETALMKNISNFFVKSIEDILLYDPENSIEFLVMTMFETILKAVFKFFHKLFQKNLIDLTALK